MDGSSDDPRAPLVLCLHGQQMQEDLFSLLLQKLFSLPMRFLIPRAPFPAPGLTAGEVGASWYSYDGDQARFRESLLAVEQSLLSLIRSVEHEHRMAPRFRILLGFSQGGYAGSFVALRNSDIFCGMIISGARVKTEFLEEEIHEAGRRGFRVLLCHGSRDKAVPLEAAQRSEDGLRAGGVEVQLHEFGGGHSLGRDQVGAMLSWLRRANLDWGSEERGA